MVITGEKEIQDYFNQLKLRNEESWNRFFEMMDSANVDLTIMSKPLLDSTYKSKSCNKNIRLVIIDDPIIVNLITKGRKVRPDVLLQVWDLKENKNLLMGGNIREDSDINWNDEKLPLNKTEKILTSWVLNSHEYDGHGSSCVVEDIVKSVADKNSFHNVFRVLD
jgi:hypothetical protein